MTRVGFLVQYFPTELGQRLALLGDAKQLGEWRVKVIARELPLGFGFWYTEVVLPEEEVRWKWGVVGAHSGVIERWEEREDRHLAVDGRTTVVYAVWAHHHYVTYPPDKGKT